MSPTRTGCQLRDQPPFSKSLSERSSTPTTDETHPSIRILNSECCQLRSLFLVKSQTHPPSTPRYTKDPSTLAVCSTHSEDTLCADLASVSPYCCEVQSSSKTTMQSNHNKDAGSSPCNLLRLVQTVCVELVQVVFYSNLLSRRLSGITLGSSARIVTSGLCSRMEARARAC